MDGNLGMAAFRRFKLDWKLKARAFNMLDRFPMGDQLYYLLQRHVTRTLPRALSPTHDKAISQLRHMERIRQQRGSLDSVVLLEFGAGWDLYSNLLYWCLGVDSQIAVDIRRWIHHEAINAVVTHLQQDPPANAIRTPAVLMKPGNLEAQLKLHYGIDYRAPFDATSMTLQDSSIDLIVTTSVLEHIPLDVCQAIICECRRVMRPDGLMSHMIDYSDHYAHSDANITAYNYLQFDETEWTRYNPSIHFQNRARTHDYCKLFRKAGFEIINIREWYGEPDELGRVPIHPSFSGRTPDGLLALGGEFLLRPA
jgi:predicted SAM-dependent methyltransferase